MYSRSFAKGTPLRITCVKVYPYGAPAIPARRFTPRRSGSSNSPFSRVRSKRGGVNKLCIFVGTLVGGYVGGYLGSGFGLMTEIVTSGIGSMVGVYLGWKLARRIER